MRALIAPVLLFAFAVPVASAGPREDAQAIVEYTVTEDVLRAAFEALSDLSVATFQNEAAKAGKLLSEDAAEVMGSMLFAEMIPLLTEGMREEMASAYVHSMSPQGLADFRSFLETPSGEEWVKAQPTLTRETTKLAETIAGPIAAEAARLMNAAIAAEEWPAGTLSSTKSEIRTFLSE
ncbi:MAG: DUF2059 domain-containing protein [Acidobacteria bacterium]|nr:DUF2059 domain-containing protein [Acidobacteriota bacterium]